MVTYVCTYTVQKFLAIIKMIYKIRAQICYKQQKQDLQEVSLNLSIPTWK